MNAYDEHAIRLSQAGEPYDDERETRWPYRWLLHWAIAIVGGAGVIYCLYRAYEALPA